MTAATARPADPSRLTVLYDERCAFCCRCRDWLIGQPTHLPIGFVAAGSPVATARYGDLPWLGADLVVVSDRGEAWIGPAAFLMCLWATVAYRPWSYRLSSRALAPLAERFFHLVSTHRLRLSRSLERRAGGGRYGHHGHVA
jgi:predicted DCC family thiol-disulfide oxidoreductase YuxK